MTKIDEILTFWFCDTRAPGAPLDDALVRWFRATEDFDHTIAERYSGTIRDADAGRLSGWSQTPRGRLALIIVLDQFPRNVFRGTPLAFAFDPKARQICHEGLAERIERSLVPVERHFFLLPLLHSEVLSDQELSVECFERLAAEAPPEQSGYFGAVVDAAHRYHRVISRFGRFPHRNVALGRKSTPEEVEFLDASTPRWKGGPRAG